MKPDTKKIIKSIKTLPQKDKEKIYDFLSHDILEQTSSRDKKLIKFGLRSLKEFRKLKKEALLTLEKSRKFTNELKKQARA